MTKSNRQAPLKRERTDQTFNAMQHYVDLHERSAPMAFVGRDEVLADLMSAVKTTAANEDAEGMTRVVQGVPGAGKTSVCREFIRRHQNEEILWVDQAGGKHRAAVFCVDLSPGALNAPPLTFVQGIHEKWLRHCRSLEAGVKQAGRAHLSRLSDIVRLWLRRNTEHESVEKTSALTERSSLDACIGAYCHDYWGEDMVIALCIDEAQNCPGTTHAKAIMGGLHNRDHPARIAPLLFGLPNTLDHVSDQEKGLGLSRLNDDVIHDICLLEPGQPREIVVGTFDRLGLEWSNPGWSGHLRSLGFSPIQWDDWRNRVADAIAEGSSDFPQHVTLGLRAACQALIDRRETLAPTGLDAMLKDIRTTHHQRKTSYYQRRLSSVIQYGAAFGAICRKAAESPDAGVTHADAKRAIAAGSSADDESLDNAQTNAILKQALGKGILRQMQDGEVGPPPIPSMSTHLELVLQRALDRGRSHALRACQAIGLSAPPMQAPTHQDEDGDTFEGRPNRQPTKIAMR